MSETSESTNSQPPKKKVKMTSKKCHHPNSKPRPNWFLALQIDEKIIQDKMTEIQNHIKTREPKFSQACVPVTKAHLTLFVFSAEQVDRIIETVNEVIANIEFTNELILEANEIGHFDHQVVYAKLKLSQNINELWSQLAEKLIENEIIEKSELKKFNPHLTLMKLSKMKKPKKGEKRLKKIPAELYEDFKNTFFGVQSVESIQLLSMTKPATPEGYYFCQHTFPIKIVQKLHESSMLLSESPKLKSESPLPQSESPKSKPESLESECESIKPKCESLKPKCDSPNPESESSKPKSESLKSMSESQTPNRESPKPKSESPKLKSETTKQESESLKQESDSFKIEGESSLVKSELPMPKSESPKSSSMIYFLSGATALIACAIILNKLRK